MKPQDDRQMRPCPACNLDIYGSAIIPDCAKCGGTGFIAREGRLRRRYRWRYKINKAAEERCKKESQRA